MPTIIADPTPATAASPLSPSLAAPDQVQPAFPGIPQSFPGEIPQDAGNPLAQEMAFPEAQLHAALTRRHQWDLLAEQAFITPDPFFQKYPFQPLPGEDTAARKRRLANRVFLRSRLDGAALPGGDMGYEVTRSRIAHRMFDGRGANDDAAFHTEALKHVQTEKDKREVAGMVADEAAAAALAAAISPGTRGGAWKATREKLKLMPGYDPADEADHVIRFRAVEQETSARLAPYAARVVAVWEGKENFSEAYDRTEEKDREGLKTAFGLLARTMPKEEQATFFNSLIKQVSRDAVSIPESMAVGLATETHKGGTWGWQDFFGTDEAVRKRNAGDAKTAADFRAKMNYIKDMRDIAEGVRDPVKAPHDGLLGTFERGVFAAPGAIASTIVGFVPVVGNMAFYGMAREDSYQTIRKHLRENGFQGDTDAVADDLASIAAIPYALADKLGAEMIAARMPWFNKLVGGITDRLVKTALARGAVRTVAGGAIETGTEMGQGYLPLLVEDMATGIQAKLPDVKWRGPDGVFEGAWTQSLETFVAMFPLAMFGAAHGHFSDQQLSLFKAASDLELKALGHGDEEISAIRGATGPATLRAAVIAANETRDPNSSEAKEAAERVAILQAQKQAVAEAAQSSGILPMFRVNPDKTIAVIDSGTGEEIATAASHTDAVRIATSEMAIREESQAAIVAHLGGILEAMQSRAKDGAAGHEVAFTYDPFKQTTAADQIAADPASTARVWKQLGITEAMSPDRRAQVLANSFVHGFSETEFRDGILSTTNRILGTGTLTTVFHEDTHGLRRVAMQRGTFTRDEQVAALRAIDAAMGKAGGTLAAKRFLSESTADADITEDQLDEAFAVLMESEVLRTGLIGTKGTATAPGIVSRYFEAAYEASPFARAALSKLRGMARYLRAMYGEVFGRAVAIRRAIDKGHINEGEYHAMLNKLMGVDEVAQANSQALITATEIIDGVERVTFADGGFMDMPFSLSHSKQLDALVAKTLSLTSEPAFRAAWMGRTVANLEKLRRDHDRTKTAFGKDYTERALSDERTRASIAKEGAMRQALRRQELEDMAWGQHNAVLSQPELALLKNQPVHEAVADPTNPLRGRLMSRGAAIKAGKVDPAQHGDYDGADGVNPTVFGGQMMPDQIAQQLYDDHLIKEPTADALWDALRREQAGVANMREYLKAARADVAQARVTARTEAKAWEAAETKRQGLDHSLHAKIVRTFGMLDGILYALPPELRGKLGLHTATLAALKSDEARLAYLDKMIARASEEIEKWLKAESVAAIGKLFERARPNKNKPGQTRRGKIGADAHEIMTWAEEFAGMTAQQIDAKAAEFDRSEVTLTDAGDDAGLLRLGVMRQTLDYAGGVFDKEARTVAEIVEAMGWLQRTYEFGRSEWQDQEAARMAEMEGLRQDVLAALLAQAGVDMPRLDLPNLDREALAKLPRDQAEKRLDEYADQVANRKAQHRARVAELLAKTGIGTKAARQAGKHEEAAKAARRMLEGGTWDFISFVQTLERVFGVDHPLVKRWNEHVRVAQIQKTDAIMAADKELREAMRAAMGGSVSPYRVEVRLAEMALNNSVRLEIAEAARAVSKSVPLATARQIAAGTAEAADWSVTQAEVVAALAEHDARADKGKQAVKHLAITTTTKGVPTMTEYTEAQAVTLILFARQPRYQTNLENAGFTPEVIEAARAQLSPEALAMVNHLAEFYRANYAPLDALFTRMFGVHMPMEDNYSPAAFERSGSPDAMAAPGAGQLQPEGGFRNGWSKTRSTHQAEPKLENAFIVFQGHLAVTEHWRAFALLTRELSAVLQHVEIKQAIETLHGKAAVGAVAGWIQALEQNGLQQRKAWGWTDRVFRHLQRNMAVIGLCMRFSTLAKNAVLPALGTARRIGLFNWLRGFSKLAGGSLNYQAFREADFITRREAAGFSQELRAAAAVMRSEMPTRSRQLAFWGMQRMAVADAASTALGAAISFDYHFRSLVDAGMPEADAKREAMAMAEDDVRRTAQPVELAERSLYELSMSPGERFMFMFATDARKDSAALMEATRRAYREHGAAGLLKSAEFRTVAGGAWLTVGFLSNLIAGILRDAGDGWDDDWLDEKNWNPLAFLSKVFLGPLSAYPLLNDLLSGFKDSGPLTDLADGGRAVKDLGKALATLDLPRTASGRELEWLEGKLVDIWRGVGLFYSPAADLAPVMNTADQVFDIGKGAADKIGD